MISGGRPPSGNAVEIQPRQHVAAGPFLEVQRDFGGGCNADQVAAGGFAGLDLGGHRRQVVVQDGQHPGGCRRSTATTGIPATPDVAS